MSGWLTVQALPGATTLELIGSWRLHQLVEIERELAAVRIPPHVPLQIDGAKLKEMDTAGAMLLLRLIGWPRQATSAAGGKSAPAIADKVSGVEFVGFPESTSRMLALVCETYQRPAPYERPRRRSLVARLGAATIDVSTVLYRLLSFVGETLSGIWYALRHPRSIRIKELFVQLDSVCIDAIPIVALVKTVSGGL